MKFDISPNLQSRKRKVIYLNEEHSFCMDVFLDTDYTLMLGCVYLGLDVDLSSMDVVNISGVCPNYTWKKKNLCPPIATQQGTIKIISGISESDLCPGTGIYLFDKTDMYFDENSGWCYIDCKVELHPEVNVQFCENTIFSLSGNDLVGIWVHLTEFL